MNVSFRINYRTLYGQSLCIIRTDIPLTDAGQQPLWMQCHGSDYWIADVNLPEGLFEYRYAVCVQPGHFVYEQDKPRQLRLRSSDREIIVHDYWQLVSYESVFRSRAFTRCLFRRQQPASRLQTAAAAATANVRWSIEIPQVKPSQGVAIMGSIKELGNWDPHRMLVMSDADFPVWRAGIYVPDEQTFAYKYVLYDKTTGEVVDMESGSDRYVWDVSRHHVVLQHDRDFRRTSPRWRGSGFAVPLFALRSESDMGIGEYTDLIPLAQWASAVGMQMIQLLPVNDTTATHTDRDSYPYNPVSVCALHPIYLHIPAMGTLTDSQRRTYRQDCQRLNALPQIDYQAVYDTKMKYFLLLYKQHHKQLFLSDEYKRFYTKNSDWLPAYAAFSAQRDQLPDSFFCFLQFHADRQLNEAVSAAHQSGVVIKGDIPIGVNARSVETTAYPQYFNLTCSTGAPPDDFDAKGQNWGFPTYRWDEMAQAHFDWWKRRLGKMQDFFDAYRIDHILGLFRIWQMPKTDVWGLCGHFDPALPYSIDELRSLGVQLDMDRLTRPYICAGYLNGVFSTDTDYVCATFLTTDDNYYYRFQPRFDTQVKVLNYFEQGEGANLGAEQRQRICTGLINLHCEVLFVRDGKQPDRLHPRACIYRSHSFEALSPDQQHILTRIYEDFFYHRHIDFWQHNGMAKIPALIHATDMLCCGEDLGMVPACVPTVMQTLHILSLEIQRMPKDSSVLFAHPAHAPYLSVCTTGTHDMNPLRAWWSEDKARTQRFYEEQLGMKDAAPDQLTPALAEVIIRQHLNSPAMWVILPIQDWLALDTAMSAADPHTERINDPSNPHQVWNYRMHLRLEDLISASEYNQHVLSLTQLR